MKLWRNRRGVSVIELAVGIGVGGAVALAVGGMLTGAMKAQNEVENLLQGSDILSKVASELDCDATYYNGGTTLASGCDAATNTPPVGNPPYPPVTNCDAVPGAGRFVILRKIGVVVPIEPIFSGGPLLAEDGGHQIRACCPNKQLYVEYRKLPVNLSELPTIPWAPLFPSGPRCPSVRTNSLNPPPGAPTVARANLTADGGAAVCRFIFSPYNNAQQQFHYSGEAQCPPNMKIVGGGVNCDNLGLVPPAGGPKQSFKTDNHPRKDGSGKYTSWYGSCCGGLGKPAALLRNRVYALCTPD